MVIVVSLNLWWCIVMVVIVVKYDGGADDGDGQEILMFI